MYSKMIIWKNGKRYASVPSFKDERKAERYMTQYLAIVQANNENAVMVRHRANRWVVRLENRSIYVFLKKVAV